MNPAPVLAPPSPFSLGFPGDDRVARALAAAAGAPLSYPFEGATSGALPEGWDHDEAERPIGEGVDDLRRAREAITAWVPFALPWVRLHRPAVALRVGELVAFSSRQLGLWTLNVCRIVAIHDDERTFGFTYGTVAGHVVAGEERFLARLDEHGTLSFGIRKFSRPNHPLVRLAGPVARHLQRRFTSDAIAAVAAAVRGARP